ncbi:MAG: SDR family oxidoreductase [Myxococcales bacterium]
MKVLLIGGGGYIGIPLAEQLLERGHTVRVLDRFYFGRELFEGLLEKPGLEFVQGDLREPDPAAFKGIDAVVLLGALSNDPCADLDPRLSQEINMDGTLRCAELAKAAGAKRMIFSSSCSVYGAGNGLLTETSATAPVSLYAKLKLDAEAKLHAMASNDFIVTSLRHATVFGLAPRMRFDLVVNLMTLTAFQKGQIFVLGGGMQWRPLVHVRDVGLAFVTVLESKPELVQREIFNVGSDDQNLRVRDVATLVASIVPNTKIEQVPSDADNRDYHVTFGKISKVLGYKTRYSVEAGAREVYEALVAGRTADHIRTRTLAFYKHLLDAERLVRELSINGKML